LSSRVDISDHEVAMPREGFSVCIGVCILGVTESLASAATALDRSVPEHFRVFTYSLFARRMVTPPAVVQA
jgi:hypothetical protein